MPYDPKTGLPIENAVSSQETYTRRFDPKTGEPVVNPQPGAYARRFDPKTGLPVAPQSLPKKKPVNKRKVVCIAVCALAAVLAIGAISVRVVLGKNWKFMIAASRTFKEDDFMKMLDVKDLIKDGKYTFAVDGTSGDYSVKGSYALSGPTGRQYMEGNVSFNGISADVKAYLDKQKFQAQIPAFSSYTFEYKTGGTKSGYLAEVLRQYGMTTDQLDRFLQKYTSDAAMQEYSKKMNKEIKKDFNELDFEKTDDETFTVDDNDVNCSGYSTVITSNMVSDWIDSYEENVSDSDGADSLLASAASSTFLGTVASTFNNISNLKKTIASMPDINLEIYLYSGKIADITLDFMLQGTKYSVSIQFQGGKTPIQNIYLEYKEDSDGFKNKRRFQLETQRDGSEETITVSYAYDEEKMSPRFEINYDFEGKDYTLKTFNTKYTTSTDGTDSIQSETTAFISGEFKRTSDTVKFSIDKAFYSGEDQPLSGTVTLTKGAKIETLDEGSVFDLGNASLSDYQNLTQQMGGSLFSSYLN